MNADIKDGAHPLLVQVQKLFQKDLAQENEYLRMENRIFRSKFEKRVPLTETDRCMFVKYCLDSEPRYPNMGFGVGSGEQVTTSGGLPKCSGKNVFTGFAMMRRPFTFL